MAGHVSIPKSWHVAQYKKLKLIKLKKNIY